MEMHARKSKKCSTSVSPPPSLLGMTSSPKESSARMTGTPTLEGVCSCRFGVSLSASRLEVLWCKTTRHEVGKVSCYNASYNALHIWAVMSSNLGAQPILTNSLPAANHFQGLSHLPGSGRGWGRRTAFEWCPQFSRKNMWSQLLLPAVSLPLALQ